MNSKARSPEPIYPDADVEQRMKDFIEELKSQSRSTSERVRQLLPLIDDARRRGGKWSEIAVRLGVPVPALTAAYRRAKQRPTVDVEPPATTASGSKPIKKKEEQNRRQ